MCAQGVPFQQLKERKEARQAHPQVCLHAHTPSRNSYAYAFHTHAQKRAVFTGQACAVGESQHFDVINLLLCPPPPASCANVCALPLALRQSNPTTQLRIP